MHRFSETLFHINNLSITYLFTYTFFIVSWLITAASAIPENKLFIHLYLSSKTRNMSFIEFVRYQLVIPVLRTVVQRAPVLRLPTSTNEWPVLQVWAALCCDTGRVQTVYTKIRKVWQLRQLVECFQHLEKKYLL